MKFKCRLTSETYRAKEWGDIVVRDVLFSARILFEEADGLLAFYDPTEELLKFNGPKLWVTQEPMSHSHFHTHPVGKKLTKILKNEERAYFYNPNKKYRIPQITARDFTRTRSTPFQEKAVATVNDCGGRYGWLKRDLALRNTFVTYPLVELYGSEKNWSQYSRFPYIWKKGLPANHCGSKAPGKDYHDPLFQQFLSGYKVYVCLENSYEPFWFTEKMVNAARAGCIPVYHAHPTVEQNYLKGALWVDPKDFSFNPRRTIEYALAQDIAKYRMHNDAWLDSGILADTTLDQVFEKVFNLMVNKIQQPSRVSSVSQ